MGGGKGWSGGDPCGRPSRVHDRSFATKKYQGESVPTGGGAAGVVLR